MSIRTLLWYEKIGFGFSFVFFVLIFLTDNPNFKNIFINLFCFSIAASLVNIFKDRHWQHLLSKNIDPNVVVFSNRDRYGKLIEEVESAKEIDVMGISLQYTVEYLMDHTDEFSKKIKKMRILLPENNKICDDRDLAQGTEVGSLYATLKKTKTELKFVKEKYPSTFDIRYFLLQPYVAYTRIDDVIWISPYIAKRGRSSPLLKISKKKSPKLFDLYYEHFKTIWEESIDEE